MHPVPKLNVCRRIYKSDENVNLSSIPTFELPGLGRHEDLALLDDPALLQRPAGDEPRPHAPVVLPAGLPPVGQNKLKHMSTGWSIRLRTIFCRHNIESCALVQGGYIGTQLLCH